MLPEFSSVGSNSCACVVCTFGSLTGFCIFGYSYTDSHV